MRSMILDSIAAYEESRDAMRADLAANIAAKQYGAAKEVRDAIHDCESALAELRAKLARKEAAKAKESV